MSRDMNNMPTHYNHVGWTDSEKKRLLAMVEQRCSDREIARQVGHPPSDVGRMRKALGIYKGASGSMKEK